MEIHEMKMKSYERAEQLSKKVIEMCVRENVTLQEFELLKAALSSAIDQKIAEVMYTTKLL